MDIKKVVDIIAESTNCRYCKLKSECSRQHGVSGETICDEAIEFLNKINK